MTNQRISRRRFMAQSSLLGATSLLAATPSALQAKKEGREFRVGCMNVTTYSHVAAKWGSLMNPAPGQLNLTGMRITHCWDIHEEGAKGFAKNHRCQAVKNFDDMLGKVDGIISGGYYCHPWNHILHMPYLKAGLPNLINRPFSNSLAKAKKMIDAAKKSKAQILVPSAFEHNHSISMANAFAAANKISSYSATNSANDYPTHGIHGLYMVCRAIMDSGHPIETVSYQAKNWHRPPGLMTFKHRDKKGRAFYGSLHQIESGLGRIRIETFEKGSRDFQIHLGTGTPYNNTVLWTPTLWAFHNMAVNKRPTQTLDQVQQKNQAFMAGWWSLLKQRGNPVKLTAVPADWESPVDLPSRPKDRTIEKFKKKFG